MNPLIETRVPGGDAPSESTATAVTRIPWIDPSHCSEHKPFQVMMPSHASGFVSYESVRS
jgi:hypothetical protein